MARTQEQQAQELVSRARQILVTTRELPTLDTLASAFAIGHLLKKAQKTFEIVIPGWNKQTLPAFLNAEGLPISEKIGALRAFHVKLNVQRVPLSELMYDIRDGVLDITLLPREGDWTPQDVVFQSGMDRYDLVIAVDASDMTSLGSLGREQAEFLYRTPIINIDCSARNEYWGQVNLVDLTAVSTSQVVHQWIEGWDKSFIDQTMATALLTGMIARTKSFRTPNVTPRTLATASTLIEQGAAREQIIHGLWRTRSVGALKLWGRALSRLTTDVATGLVWTTITESDLIESGVPFHALDGIVDELISYAPEARAVAVFFQHATQTNLHLYALPPLNAQELIRPFGGQGTREEGFVTLKNETQAETSALVNSTIEQLKESLKTS
jgi:nanoRNase/pAp phosphatase (c-di-AMP/oligoRNAs hydrolase)